ncbi:uncharacterized protein BKA55DRAFT_69160 [Fusarium redolens]|uniref:Uncharacterized protein n=1 Tax=Fusarium redolens TaxID=48865 RepID=A0A9P9H0F7_FUSRE|nr:uncharacterized protein BKA55DRAFT_69160 [Fusarium redolens]KAH7247582.1 hypothetical protein BKA55DRAFT_69160 [Fusarium redolens]KAH7465204.1 hypothetical protein FOMA001_g17005 [Fusarium oxysporum f. sp. matthiolae]
MKGLVLFLFALSVNAQCRRQNACRPDGGVVAPGQNCRPNTDYCNLGACGNGQTCRNTEECDGWIKANWYNNCYVECVSSCENVFSNA